MPIHIGTATVEYTDDGCLTRYEDGSSYGALPHHNDHHYTLIAARCGYRPDHEGRLQYAREHECAHHMVSEWIMGCPSYVVWSLAHGAIPGQGLTTFEEMAAQTFQRWLRANERPIIGGIDWDDLKARALGLLNAL